MIKITTVSLDSQQSSASAAITEAMETMTDALDLKRSAVRIFIDSKKAF